MRTHRSIFRQIWTHLFIFFSSPHFVMQDQAQDGKPVNGDHPQRQDIQRYENLSCFIRILLRDSYLRVQIFLQPAQMCYFKLHNLLLSLGTLIKQSHLLFPFVYEDRMMSEAQNHKKVFMFSYCIENEIILDLKINYLIIR